jgi:AcrR family transcriptional regulator
MAKSTKTTPLPSAEERIKRAARKVFTGQGYQAARTRDIAREAGVNVALLNYYFHGKRKLFNIVMREQIVAFKELLLGVLTDESTTLERKLELLAGNYIDLFLAQPDLPAFLVQEMRAPTSDLVGRMSPVDAIFDSSFHRQLVKALGKRQADRLHPLHFLMSLGGMAVFPFVIAPLVKHGGRVSPSEFEAMMRQRKKLIPIWVRAMIDAA